MDSLLEAFAGIETAAKALVSPENVSEIERLLRSRLQVFPLDGSHSFPEIDAGSGVYYFEIRFPFTTQIEFEAFNVAWGCRGATALQKSTSRIYPQRARAHVAKVEAGEFVPFYLGKCKHVRTRVTQHLTGGVNSGTYGMKLLSRAKLLQGCELRVSSATFEIPDVAYFCMELLEAALRKRLQPMVGKQ